MSTAVRRQKEAARFNRHVGCNMNAMNKINKWLAVVLAFAAITLPCRADAPQVDALRQLIDSTTPACR